MVTVEANPCSCGSKNLKPKWNSADGVGWVHCDSCGKVSSPVALCKGRDAIVTKWNEENPNVSVAKELAAPKKGNG